MSAQPKLELKDVTKSFGRNHVLRGVNISIEKGKSLVIIGGSGTGKSVTIKCVLGLLHPDKGSIKVDGVETAGVTGKPRDDLMKKFGMLFQGGALFDSLPIWENVGFGLMQGKGVSKEDARVVAIEKLRAVGLAPRVADMLPAELSGGMQKRVGLARAIASNPEIIFFDEPTTGLDPIMADVINDLIVETSKGLGATTLSITHDMASARKIADNIAMIHKGQIIWQGDAKDIDHSGNEYVDQFIKGSATGPIKMEI
ncbi:MAG: ATP-binding cassette domain-containing protein [bacterium]|nr:ATP-binding cassette domain-containing protein [bacterium]